MSTSSHKLFHRLHHEQFHDSHAEGGLHQPAQQCGGKAASEKKAQHGKKPLFYPVFLSGSQKFITEQVLRVERGTANNPKGSTWMKVSDKKTLCKLITGGLAEVFNGKRDSWINPLHFKHFAPFISFIQHFSPCRKGQGRRLWWLYLVGCGGFASALI